MKFGLRHIKPPVFIWRNWFGRLYYTLYQLFSKILSCGKRNEDLQLTSKVKIRVISALRAIPIAAVFICLSFALNATIYYAAPNGSNSNPGTLEFPWETAKYSIERLAAGDRLYLRGGIYPVESQINIRNSGWKNNWIRIMAYPDEIPVLDASHTAIGADGAIISARDKNFIRIENLHIQNSSGGGFLFTICDSIELHKNVVSRTFNSGIRFYGDHIKNIFSNNIKIIGNYVLKPNCYELKQPDDDRTKSPHEGITIGRVNGFECAYNELCYGDKEGIDCKGPTRNGIIHNNHVHHQLNRPWSVAIYCDAWTHDSLMNIEIYENILHDCDDGIQIQSEDGRDVVDLKIHNNLIYNMGWSGLGASNNSPWKDGTNQDGITQNIYFWNNTVYNAKDAVWLHGEIQNIYFINNIFSNSKNHPIDNENNIGFTEKNIIFKKNLFFGGITTSELDQMQIPDNLTDNPGFVRTAVSDFRLNENSPAKNAGTTAYEFNVSADKDLGFAPVGQDYLTTSVEHLLIEKEQQQVFAGFTSSQHEFEINSEVHWVSPSLWNDRILLSVELNRTNQRRKAMITLDNGVIQKEMIVWQKAGSAYTHLPDLSKVVIKVFPTMIREGHYFITHNMNPEKTVVSVFNLQGTCVLKKNCVGKNERFDLNDNWIPGMYIVRVQSDGNQFEQKIIIN
jgi:hypothetical protein